MGSYLKRPPAPCHQVSPNLSTYRLHILYLQPRRSFLAVRHCTSPCRLLSRVGSCILPSYWTHPTYPIPYRVLRREPYTRRASKPHSWCNRALSRHRFRRCHCRLRDFRGICRQLPQGLEMALLFWPERSTGISCHLRRALYCPRRPRGRRGNTKPHAVDHWLKPQGT